MDDAIVFNSLTAAKKPGLSIDIPGSQKDDRHDDTRNRSSRKSDDIQSSGKSSAILKNFMNNFHRRSSSDAAPPKSPSMKFDSTRSQSAFLSSSIGSSSTLSAPMSPTSPARRGRSAQSPTAATTGKVKETSVLVRNVDPTTGKKMINRYLVLDELGRGVHGKVKLCVDTETGDHYALKIVNKRSKKRFGMRNDSELKIKKEIAIMKKCTHPNIVQLFEVIDDPNQEKIYLVLEYVDGGELQWRNDYDEPIASIDQIKTYLLHMVIGLDYLHYQGIVHRDIKPQNILLTRDGVVKIADFGVSFFSEQFAGEPGGSDQELAKTVGSPAFFAPELCVDDASSIYKIKIGGSGADMDVPQTAPHSFEELQLQQQDVIEKGSRPSFVGTKESSKDAPSERQTTASKRAPIGKAIDVWALGVTLYCLMYAQLPFQANNEFELFVMISRKPVEFPTNTLRGDILSEDPDLKDLFQKLFEKDPEKRITLAEVKRHKWLWCAVPGSTDEERLKWIEDGDPDVYCKRMFEIDPEGRGKHYDAQGRIQVTEEEVKRAVSAGVVLRRLVEAVKRRFSRGLSWLNQPQSAFPQEERRGSKSSLLWSNMFRRSSQQLFSADTDTPSTPKTPTTPNAEDEEPSIKRNESSLEEFRFIKPRYEEEASTEPLALLRLKIAADASNEMQKRVMSESNLERHNSASTAVSIRTPASEIEQDLEDFILEEETPHTQTPVGTYKPGDNTRKSSE